MRQETGHENAVLTVERRDPADVRVRQVVVALDGEPFATLLFGQAATRPIPAGPHRMRLHNTLIWKNVRFDAAPGEHVRFRTVNRAGPGSMTLLALLGAGPLYITVERVEPEQSQGDSVDGRA